MMKFLTFIFLLIAIPAQALDPGTFDLTVYAGEDYVLNLTHKANGVPVNLTGYQFKLQAKKPGSATPFLTMSSAFTNRSTGQTRHKLSKAYTRSIVNQSGNYDLMQTAPNGTVSYRLKGSIRILETVTR